MKMLLAGVMVATLVASPVFAKSHKSSSARAAAGEESRHEQCRDQTKRTWPKGGDDLDRARDFMMSNCMNSDSQGAFHPY
jgi:hypothetical protein